MIYIATDHTENAGLPTEFVDEHFYSAPIFFAANSKMYDKLNGVKIYCGEYASTIGCKAGTLYGALGEAAFLTGIERNQDKVRMTSYAPLFKNVDYVSWEPDMIVFNNHADYVIPSYYMLKMFAENRGDYVCRHNVISESTPRSESGYFCDEDGNITHGNKFSGNFKNNAVHIRFWDRGTAGEEQNHFDWIAENGKSRVVHYNGWSCETICGEIPCNILPRNSMEITAEKDYFKIILNGEILHEHTLEPIPNMFGVCTVDSKKNEIITKLVNFSEKEISVKISCDRETENGAEMTVLTAGSYDARNSFENPEAVSPYNVEVKDGNNLSLLPRSINVIRQKMK